MPKVSSRTLESFSNDLVFNILNSPIKFKSQLLDQPSLKNNMNMQFQKYWIKCVCVSHTLKLELHIVLNV
jgi:hypothetical protein